MNEQPSDGNTSSSRRWLNERVYLRHSVLYGVAVVVWATAVAFIPGEWTAFWPMMFWTIAYMLHFLVYKGTHIDPEWINNRVVRLADEAKDSSHIEAIRDDYTGIGRQRKSDTEDLPNP